LTPLQRKMKEKLSGARFRWLNEQLYTTPGDKSFKLFQEKPELFDEYHEGFRHQVESWPVNPVDVIIDQLRRLPKSTVIADLGCGDAMIAQTLKKHKVLSFDLIAKNDFVTACDISKLPLEANSVDVAVFSLSLMGTNYIDFLKEAHRVLKVGGELKIAEVVSRFSDVDAFITLLEELGFDFMDKDDDNKMFIMLYFTKQPNYEEEVEDEVLAGLSKTQKRALKKGAGLTTPKVKLQKKAQKLLKPCLYKKR
ncbi:25S rRNA (adenine645-N1)-methyltransferase, partial [Rhizopus microsporus ATCC 52813]